MLLIAITDATVANRTVELTLRRPGDEHRIQGFCKMTLAASSTRRVELGAAQPATNYNYADSHSLLSPYLWIPEDYFIAFEVDTDWKAGDTYSLMVLATPLPM